MAEIPPSPPWALANPEAFNERNADATSVDAALPATRDPVTGRFIPGMSGNPKGRPPARWGAELQALMPRAIAALGIAIDKGDVSAVAALLARTVAPLRAEAGLVEFELDSTAPPPEQRRQIREAVAQGKLTLEQAHQMTDLLDKHQAGDEWHPLIERLKKRKAKHAQQPAQLVHPQISTVNGKTTIVYPGMANDKDSIN